ncbi:MAG: PEP-CTERM sorting domain-containing protein [Chthonomonas sp.]|nr:PEP-CTERM sorting domain-containing protein [Chthonomonas sp.]
MKKLLLLTITLPFSAQAINFEDIRFWAGSGTNRAAVVIDFNDGQTPRSYVWGYRWNGSARGEDALRTIVQADPLLDAVIDQFSFGASLNTASYLPQSGGGYRHSRAQDFGPAGLYWSYWTATQVNPNWAFSNSGMSDRVLNDGDIDGWAMSDPNFSGVPPTSPVPAVPEPAVVIALGSGLAAVLRRRPC